LGAQVADIERIRQILGDEKLILIGHSWGGFLASLYAAEFPERVQALILVSPANVLIMPQPEEESDLFASVRSRLTADQQAEFDEFMAGYMNFNTLFDKSEDDLIALNEIFAEYYVSVMDEAAIERVAGMPQQGRPGGWMVWAQYLSMGKKHDYSSALASVQAPVLVIHGADDLQSEAASRLYSDAFPNAKFVVIQDASHFAFGEQPETFAKVVTEFLDQ
jgi:proline iminopeptidase